MFNQSLSMRVIITIDDVSHIAVPDSPGKRCNACSLGDLCLDEKEEGIVLCGFLGLEYSNHFELLIPETKSKEDDKG